MNKRYDVAAYVWPAYTGDEPRTRMFWPEGIGEWQSVKNAVKKFPEHDWPRKPLWGYVNEADRYIMEMQIEAAVDHGVNVFIYDWYWYDRRPFLENCLNDGFLKAKNSHKMKFYLMWANHNATSLWDIRTSSQPENVIWDGSVDEHEFKRAMRHAISKYFSLENYYRIDGRPVFSIYDIPNLVNGLGGLENTRKAFGWFRDEAASLGLPAPHLQFVMWNERFTSITGIDGSKSVPASTFGQSLGFDSATHYQFVHFADINRSYQDILADVQKEWERLDGSMDRPYFPHISVGWDPNPRFVDRRQGIMRDASPQNIEAGLRLARDYVDAHPNQPPLITINSWNEWTETSYLEPDDRNGYGYLEAVRNVFVRQE